HPDQSDARRRSHRPGRGRSRGADRCRSEGRARPQAAGRRAVRRRRLRPHSLDRGSPRRRTDPPGAASSPHRRGVRNVTSGSERSTPMPAHPDSAPAGVIHDIGYRHYDGDRLGRAAITRALFWHSLRGAYGLGRSARSKILPMSLFAIMCIPAFIIAVIANVGALNLSDLPLPYERYVITTQGVLTIFLAAQAPQSVSRDLRFKTVPLYFSRPLERVDYIGAKFAAMSAAMFILIGVPLLIMYIGALLAEFSVVTHSREVAVALLGAAVFAIVLSGIGLLIASMTPRRGFGVAAIITVLALSYGA